MLTNQENNGNQTELDAAKPKSRARKVFNICFGVLAALVLVFSVFVMVSTIRSRAKGEDPTFFGRSLHVVVTGSMEPQIMTNDLIVVKKVTTDELDAYIERNADDIAAARSGAIEWRDMLFDKEDTIDLVFFSTSLNKVVVHRLAYKDGSNYYTFALNQPIGDGSEQGNQLDAAIKPENIRGIVVAKSTFFGKVFYFFLTNSWVLFIILLGILAVVIVVEIINIFKAKNEIVAQKNAAEIEAIRERAREDALREAGLHMTPQDDSDPDSDQA